MNQPLVVSHILGDLQARWFMLLLSCKIMQNPNIKWMRTGGIPISPPTCFEIKIMFRNQDHVVDPSCADRKIIRTYDISIGRF